MLEIKGVKKSYGEFQLDCSLNVEKGRITGLVGAVSYTHLTLPTTSRV